MLGSQSPRISLGSCGNIDSSASDGDHDFLMLAARIHEAEAEGAKRREAAASRVREIMSRWQDEKKLILGDEAWSRRSELVRSRREEAHRLAETSASAQELNALRKETRRMAHELVRGADLRKLAEIRSSFAEELYDLLEGGSPTLSPVETLEEEEVPEVIRKRSHNPPFTITAPFPGSWASFYHWFSTGDSQLTNNYLDAATGRVGARTTFANDGSDNNDYCDTELTSRMAFTVPPLGKPSKWKFTLKTICGAARARFRWDPDWYGDSFTSDYMKSQLRIAISTEPPTNLLSYPFNRANIWPPQHFSGDNDFDLPLEFFSSGKTYWWTWTSSFQLPNQKAAVEVGTADYTNYYLDDMSVDNIMNNRWYIEQVTIELVS
jgi:hypothetical protein